MTYWKCDYDFSNIREVIEAIFVEYLSNYDLDNVTPIIKNKINIHYKRRELLVMFINVMCEIIPTYKSRRLFAIDNAEMIINHHAYCLLAKPVVGKFCDWEGVKEAQQIIACRAESKERYLVIKQCKIVE